MTRVLIDTNVILDIALKRDPFFEHAANLFTKIDQKKISGFITASSITDIYYILKKDKGHDKAIEFIFNLTEIITILGVDKEIIMSALRSGMKDFEDAVQTNAAKFNDIDIIITRNTNDFDRSGVKIFTPAAFIGFLNN